MVDDYFHVGTSLGDSVSIYFFTSVCPYFNCLLLTVVNKISYMWILKNSKDLLDNLKSRYFSQVSSIKTFDFSALYTTLPHDKLKTRLKETIHKDFSHRNYGSKCVVLGYNSTYFSKKFKKVKHATSRNK